MSTEKNPRNLLDELETLQKVLDDAAGEQIDFDRVLTQLNTVDEIPVLSDLFSKDEPAALKPVKNTGRSHLSAVKTPEPASRPVISRDVLEFIRNEMQRKGNEDNAIDTLSALLGKAHLQDTSKMSANDFAGSQRPAKPEPLVFDDSHVFEPMPLDDLLDGIGNSQRGKDHHLPDDLAEAMFAAIDGDDDGNNPDSTDMGSSNNADDHLITLLDEAQPEDDCPLIDTILDNPEAADDTIETLTEAIIENSLAADPAAAEPAQSAPPKPQEAASRQTSTAQSAAQQSSLYAAIDSKAYQPPAAPQPVAHQAVDLSAAGQGSVMPTTPVSRPSNNPFLPQSVLDRLTSERLAAQHSAEEAHRTMQRVMEQKQQKDAAALAQLDTLEKEKLVEDLINELTPTIQARLRERLRSMVGLKHPAPKR